MITDVALDLGYRVGANGQREFFLLDSDAREVASFDCAGGPIIAPAAEQAALAFARARGCEVNYLPSWQRWQADLSALICKLSYGAEYR